MTIAVRTSPDNAIASLADLVAEVRDEMDDEGFDLPRIYRAVTRAEAVFNRSLRVPRMEREYAFAVTGEYTDLPPDFLGMRTIYFDGLPDLGADTYSPGGLRAAFGGGAGRPQGYAIEGNRLVLGPVGAANIKLTYWAAIPPLTVDNPSNWLLAAHSDLYLHQVLAILFNKIGDTERAGLHLGVANGLIADINAAGNKARYGAGPLVPRLTPIGSRVAV